VKGLWRVSLLVLSPALLCALALSPFAAASPLSQKKQRLHDVQAKLQKVYAKADAAVESYNQATGRLESVREQIKENEHLLKVAEYNLGIAEQQLQERAAEIYKSRDVNVVDVLFSSSSFDELVTELNLMQRIGDSDVDTVASIKAYKKDINDRRLELAADKKAAAKLVAERRAKKNKILGIEAQLKRMTGGLRADIKRLEAEQAAAAAAAAVDTSTGTPPPGGYDPGGPGHPEVVAIAQRYLGVKYVYGGASPSSGFDCSGLVMYCYAQIGIGLAHSATLQEQASQPVSISNLQAGDLVFFGGGGYYSHVGIYVGGGTMIDAPHTGAVVRYDSISGASIGGRL
jgi:cell wall-associated NlpC family hydrolase